MHILMRKRVRKGCVWDEVEERGAHKNVLPFNTGEAMIENLLARVGLGGVGVCGAWVCRGLD